MGKAAAVAVVAYRPGGCGGVIGEWGVVTAVDPVLARDDDAF